ncbi:MAG: ParM/StbA family protein [Bacilli bacterium]|uniref:ParM/StbA family protein n=1 Tax=Clostridium sp. TaxID=1506 RepID=UPI002FCC90F2
MSTETKKRTVKKAVEKAVEKLVEEIVADSQWGLDLGRMDTQLVGEDCKRDIIPSRILVDAEGVFGNTHTINGKVCEISVDSPFSYRQNKNEEHSIKLGHYILARNISHGDIVDVGVGLPLDIYRNKVERMDFANNFRNHGEPIVVDDKSFTINKVLVCPEGIAATTQHKLRRYTLVVDIGGRNVNVAIVDKYGRPIISTIITLDEGMHDCLREMSNNMRVELVNEKHLSSDAFLDIVLNGGGKKIINEFMNKYFKKYIKELFDKLDLIKEFDRATMDILFVGGSSDYLRDIIDAHVEQLNAQIEDKADHYIHMISEEGKWDNVTGYFELLKSVTRK